MLEEVEDEGVVAGGGLRAEPLEGAEGGGGEGVGVVGGAAADGFDEVVAEAEEEGEDAGAHGEFEARLARAVHAEVVLEGGEELAVVGEVGVLEEEEVHHATLVKVAFIAGEGAAGFLAHVVEEGGEDEVAEEEVGEVEVAGEAGDEDGGFEAVFGDRVVGGAEAEEAEHEVWVFGGGLEDDEGGAACEGAGCVGASGPEGEDKLEGLGVGLGGEFGGRGREHRGARGWERVGSVMIF